MKTLSQIFMISAAALMSTGMAKADVIFHLPMELNDGQVTETVSGVSYDVPTANVAESVQGAKGKALRLDGYSNYVSAPLELGSLSNFTFSFWSAMETWPIIEHDVQNDTEATCIAGNYDAEAKSGFGFFVTRTGRLSFKFYSNGWPAEVVAPNPLPLYQWNNLVAVGNGSKVAVYNNGELIGSTNCRDISGDGTLMVGKSATGRKMGPFLLNTVNGIIDEVMIYNEALPEETIKGWKAEAEPDLAAVDADKYADDLWRPTFHGMPTRNWTNETHGLVYYNGQYHLFFQKNANGPYMSRLQWGHLVSDNLYEWREMPIALGSDKWYDLKGCWSGCVAVDDVVTGGKPALIYTGVDYARAMIGMATPATDDLLTWIKGANPIIDGKPAGLSDDFRDPYFFRNGDDAYIIVGSSKDGKGVCTLHKFNPVTRQWSNDGATFYQAANAMFYGSFWEMPNLTKIGDKYLFTATPLGLSGGVRILYWTGTLNADGTYNTSVNPATVELKGFAKEGYGMLSPSIMQHDGKTIAMGIVPDKLPSETNYEMGWAHTYSLPREWNLNDAGQLLQTPFSGLEGLRTDLFCPTINSVIEGVESLGDMTERTIEVEGNFTVADAEFGFTFFSNGSNGARLSYNPKSSMLRLDLSGLSRVLNDQNTFNGVYESTLPTSVAKGSVMKMHVYVDHSIMDIFINDSWATSVRLFPTDPEATGAEVFSDGGATEAVVKAWSLDASSTGIADVFADNVALTPSSIVNVYNVSGQCVRQCVAYGSATSNLAPGVYIVAGKKVVVR